jgi:hypothetical protein
MFDDPDESRAETANDAAQRATEKLAELRMYAELAAIYEGPRKFGADIRPDLPGDPARFLQKSLAKLARSKVEHTCLIAEAETPLADDVLTHYRSIGLSTGDYHCYTRPGEVMMLRWLAGDEVDTFYDRFQAHFEAGLAQAREEEKHNHAWKNDQKLNDYLEALQKTTTTMVDYYARPAIRSAPLRVLSTLTAEEMNIEFLTGQIMNRSPVDVVGTAFAPPAEASESDLAWFYRLFSLRGVVDDIETMCFFTYLQKVDDSMEFE